jgi:hypothetical protein
MFFPFLTSVAYSLIDMKLLKIAKELIKQKYAYLNTSTPGKNGLQQRGRKKILYITAINQSVYNSSQFLSSGSTFLHKIRWVLKNCDAENKSKLKNYEGL